MDLVLSDLTIPTWFYVYGMPVTVIMLFYVGQRKLAHYRSRNTLTESIEAGLTEPASLHPLIDPNKCLGCAACVKACPEKKILGIIGGKAKLINPTSCVGHGACARACPFTAITLVFGTEKRGVDIPMVNPNFETNVPGIYIAGELGGMGLIRNAIRQGVEAMNSIAKHEHKGDPSVLDVVIVGAGPAGIASTLAAMKHKLRFVTLEQDTFGGTVSHFPRGKIVMTAPAELPLAGKMQFKETSKEALMEFWEGIREKTGLKIQTSERVDKIEQMEGYFIVTTSKGAYQTHTVLLSIGRRGTPRTLGVPGEELPKVVYRLIDPQQYRGQKVLIVGGGDSALEAALSIADEPGTTVSISYRSETFSRAKPKNRDRTQAAIDSGRITVYMKSNIKTINERSVLLDQEGQSVEIPNDAVIINAGGILPTAFLKSIGIEVETKFGTA
ncbi:MAG: NAD(P)-binding domain-containing protein [Gammaproteobacteria bacterium]|nr:NAD(P)-binding domain-containing protein [Gammaproteobacteria bacterium]